MKKIVPIAFLCLLVTTGTACSKTVETRHDVTYSRQGTRSEARHGRLYINEHQIPDNFTRILVDGISYIFLQRENLWGDDGYFPEETAPIMHGTNIEISTAQLEQGWYPGTNRLKNTPADWIFVSWTGGSAFVKIESIQALISAENIPRIPREPRLRILD